MSKAHWLALSKVSGIGGVTVRKLIERFGSIEDAFDASNEDLLTVPRIREESIVELRGLSLEQIESELALLSDEEIEVLTWDDDDYPTNLKTAPDAPPLLFMRGELLPGDSLAVAIVGARTATATGTKAAFDLASRLAWQGVTIVSGLALGIDTAGHKGALSADKGRTIAVPGSGLRVIHPRENAVLAEDIVLHGALLSEVHLNAFPLAASLMARDRIVSGLAQSVIVVEAELGSGSMDTAGKAAKQGRTLYAVPGSSGTDELIRSGKAVAITPDSDLTPLVYAVPVCVAEEGQLDLF